MKYIYGALVWIVWCGVYGTPHIYRYRIYCNTESQNVYQWAQTPPTTCPNNTAHTVNLKSISIVDEQGPSLFTIKEESTPTGGNYCMKTEAITVTPGPGVISSLQFSWPFDISVLAIYMLPDATNAGDVLTITVGENTLVGNITQDIATGATVIPVSSSVIAAVAKGYYLTLQESAYADNLGRIIGIDTMNNTLTVETATVHQFLASNTVRVLVSAKPVDGVELVDGLPYTIGMKKIGGSYIPANTVVTVDYLNTTSTTKKLVLAYEYLY